MAVAKTQMFFYNEAMQINPAGQQISLGCI